MRIPSLDGLRTIAVSLVVICHLGNDYGIPDIFNAGDLGVRIFFVISGFLITGLLLRELDADGTINLQQFYFRRTLRIFPAFYTYITVMLLLSAYGWSNLTPLGAIPALTYTSNYWTIWDQSGYVTSHTWSLSTEEQFYLVWPALLLISGRRSAPLIMLAVVLSSPLLRTVVYLQSRSPDELAAFHLNFDHIGFGCLLAFFRDKLHKSKLYLRILNSWTFCLIPVFILVAAAQGNHPSIHRTILLFLINGAVALCIDWAVTHHGSLIGKALNVTAVAWCGRMSYSIYLWQQPFLHLNSSIPSLNIPQMSPVLALVCILACSIVSYYFVEQPCLRLRGRWSPRHLWIAKNTREAMARTTDELS